MRCPLLLWALARKEPASGESKRYPTGELAEWLKAVVLKTIVGVSSPGVRIPHSPPESPEKSGLFRSPARWLRCLVIRKDTHLLAPNVEQSVEHCNRVPRDDCPWWGGNSADSRPTCPRIEYHEPEYEGLQDWVTAQSLICRWDEWPARQERDRAVRDSSLRILLRQSPAGSGLDFEGANP